ncbi:hypothetical protein GE09DRAFT_288340 [Coniochaeta sp. 2T2.1]|nr:hypothetical protein GE09DRAFT_288340 [Coniochaeta sp. 2T2.1]
MRHRSTSRLQDHTSLPPSARAHTAHSSHGNSHYVSPLDCRRSEVNEPSTTQERHDLLQYLRLVNVILQLRTVDLRYTPSGSAIMATHRFARSSSLAAGGVGGFVVYYRCPLCCASRLFNGRGGRSGEFEGRRKECWWETSEKLRRATRTERREDRLLAKCEPSASGVRKDPTDWTVSTSTPQMRRVEGEENCCLSVCLGHACLPLGHRRQNRVARRGKCIY